MSISHSFRNLRVYGMNEVSYEHKRGYVHEQLPGDTVRMTLLPVETRDRKQNHENSIGRKPFFANGSFGGKQEIVASLCGSQL